MDLSIDWIPAGLLLARKWRFGPYEYDSGSRLLSKDGARIQRLTPQMSMLLVLALSRAGEVCTREELCTALWTPDYPGAELALTNLVRKLRVLLNDDTERPQYLETVPRSGYRFLVKPESDGDGATPDPMVARGEELLARRTPAGYRAAISGFEQVAIHSPGSPHPFVGLSLSHLMAGVYAYEAPADSFVRAEECARWAGRLGAPGPSVEPLLAMVDFLYRWKRAEARRRLEPYTDAHPGRIRSLIPYALIISAEGEVAEALMMLTQARQRDPQHLGLALTEARIRIQAGDAAGALRLGRLLVESHEESALGLAVLSQAEESAGRFEDALRSVRRSRRLAPEAAVFALLEARYLARAGEQAKALHVLSGTLSRSGWYADPAHEALAWLALDQRRQVEMALTRALYTRSSILAYAAVDQRWKAIDKSRVFLDILSAIGSTSPPQVR